MSFTLRGQGSRGDGRGSDWGSAESGGAIRIAGKIVGVLWGSQLAKQGPQGRAGLTSVLLKGSRCLSMVSFPFLPVAEQSKERGDCPGGAAVI